MDAVVVEFQGTTDELFLSVLGYDIDTNSEISVTLNGQALGTLPKGTNNGFNESVQFPIDASLQLPGTNRIEFIQSISGWKWGITDISLDQTPVNNVDFTFTPGVTETGEYGWAWGSNNNMDAVAAEFQGTTNDLFLSVLGYDIDTNTEITVTLNGQTLGNLPIGTNNGFNESVQFPIDASLQLPGTNRIEFIQSVSGWKWGVTDISLDQTPVNNVDFTITPGVTETGEYGWAWGSNNNMDAVVVEFQGTTNDLFLSVLGYDIDTNTEISVTLNGQTLGNLPKGANNGFNESVQFPIDASLQLSGTNRIEFTQSITGWKWGITDIELEISN